MPKKKKVDKIKFQFRFAAVSRQKTAAERNINKRNFQLGAVIFLLAVFIVSAALFWPSDFFKNFARAISGNYSKTDGQIIDANIWNTLAGDFVSYTGTNNNVDLGAHNLTVNTNTLFIDSANGRVGVGTASPGNYKLDVAGNINFSGDLYQNGSPYAPDSLWSAGTGGIYYSAGKVGIGASAPNKDLHIYRDSGDNAEIDLQSVSGAGQHWAIYHDRTSDDLRFWNTSDRVTIADDGNVGIGTAAPSNTLAIETGAGLANKGLVMSDGGQVYAQLIDVSSASDSGTLELFYNGTKSVYISAADSSGAYFNSGNVGIGTASPGYELEVNGTGQFGSGSDEGVRINPGKVVSYAEIIGINAAQTAFNDLNIRTGNDLHEGIYLKADTGNVGIGTTDPSDRKLMIAGSNATNLNALGLMNTDTTNNNKVALYFQTKRTDGAMVAPVSLYGITTDHSSTSVDGEFAINTVYDNTEFERLRIAANGNVGIGTAAPGKKLDVAGDIMASGVTPTYWLGPDSGSTQVYLQREGNTLNIGTANNPRIKILENGNVGIGTASPGAKLEVAGQVKITGGAPGAGKVLTSDAAGLATWEAAGGVPSGFIGMFNASCPSGWTYLSAMAGRFPRGAATYGATGGADTHNHGATGLSGPSHTHSGPSHSHSMTHTHGLPFNFGWVSGQGIHLGWVGQFSGSFTSNSSISIADEGSWGPVSKFVSDAASSGTTGVEGTGATGPGGTGAVTGSTAYGDNVPAYLNVVFCLKN